MPLDTKAPEPEWVVEITQGHWDCPDGYAESKPDYGGLDTAQIITDKKGHYIPNDHHGHVTCLKLDTNKSSDERVRDGPKRAASK